MLKNPIKLSATLLGMALVAFTSCEDQDFTDVNNDATRVEVNTISPEMAKVRDYVPDYAVMAHRGSTFGLRKKQNLHGVGHAKWV